MANKETIKKLSRLDKLEKQEEKIIALLKEEREQAQKKFPIVFGLLATFGVAAIFAGFNRFIEQIEFLNNNPLTLVGFGLFILVITGAAYRKLN